MTRAITTLLEQLRRNPKAYASETQPHPRAATLSLPDGTLAPESLRLWAAFDDHYPTYLSARRSDQPIADDAGKVLCVPMKRLLKHVCIDTIREELEGDDETIAYLNEVVATFAIAMPGFGVYLEPEEQPDRFLWFPPGKEAVVCWYEDDAIDRRAPFAAWAASLFE